jgi:4'-phosphopantetheinyl transferase
VAGGISAADTLEYLKFTGLRYFLKKPEPGFAAKCRVLCAASKRRLFPYHTQLGFLHKRVFGCGLRQMQERHKFERKRLESLRTAISVIDLKSDETLVRKAPALSRTAIHVWEFPLVVPQSLRLECGALLSLDERERAARFHFERDAHKFTVARGSLRSILSSYVGTPPGDLRFNYSTHGKPSISGSSSELRFSISHSGDFALVAVARGREVGVDIEKIREDVETDKLAERFFSEAERIAIGRLVTEQRVPAFFRCWTCKEAFLKAQGVGLSRSLSSFDVEVNTDRAARLLATRPQERESNAWILYDIKTAAGYAAAVAIEGSVNDITILRISQK